MGTRRCLKIISWNCDGIKKNILEFQEFVKKHNPDIIFLKETKLRPCISLKIQNYFIFWHDFDHRNSARTIRGTAVCIKNNLHFYPATSVLPTNCVDATVITIRFPSEPPLAFFSVYVPGRERVSDVIADIRAQFLVTSTLSL